MTEFSRSEYGALVGAEWAAACMRVVGKGIEVGGFCHCEFQVGGNFGGRDLLGLVSWVGRGIRAAAGSISRIGRLSARGCIIDLQRRTEMVLVVGATGLVGNEVCQRLSRLGEPVRALVRTTSSRDQIETLRSSGAELCIGDLKDPRGTGKAIIALADGCFQTSPTLYSRRKRRHDNRRLRLRYAQPGFAPAPAALLPVEVASQNPRL
jgi:NmrA-like family protein